MKTILFFHRCELTYLYISIAKNLPDDIKQIHVAYSSVEENILHENNINDCINYSSLFNEIIDKQTLDYNLIKNLDEIIIKNSNGRFNLNGSIQSDRGYSILKYNEALLSAQSHYLIWNKILTDNHVDIFLHEPCSLCINHIAALLCKHYGGHYLYQIANYNDTNEYTFAFAEGDDFSYNEFEYYYKYFQSHKEYINIERCKKLLEKFRKDFSVFFGGKIQEDKSRLILYIRDIKIRIKLLICHDRYDKIKNNIDYWISKQNISQNKIRNIKEYKNRNIHFEVELPQNEKYYYYSFHLEPEATVLYLGDGIYENQVKLIQNIAASIPPGTFLYVKDHPHEYAYRDAVDYERLLKVPNIRLIHQSIPGKVLIKNAIGVFTINGTAGFEGLLLGKQVYCFAKNQYSFHHRVSLIQNVKDIREEVYKRVNDCFKSDDDLYPYIFALIKSSHKGYIDFFCNRAEKLNIDQESNGVKIAQDLVYYLNHIDTYCNCENI